MKVREDVSFEFFHRFELFDGLSAEELESLAELVECRVYGSGERILEEGDESRDMFLLSDGTVDILKADGDESRSLATLEPEAVIGELGFVLGEPRSATAVAGDEAEVLQVDGADLVGRRDAGDVAAYKVEHNVLRGLARRQSEMNTQLMEAMKAAGEEDRFERDEVTDLREQLSQNWSF